MRGLLIVQFYVCGGVPRGGRRAAGACRYFGGGMGGSGRSFPGLGGCLGDGGGAVRRVVAGTTVVGLAAMGRGG